MKLFRWAILGLGSLLAAGAAAHLLTLLRPAHVVAATQSRRAAPSPAPSRAAPAAAPVIAPDWRFITAPAWSLLWQEEAILAYEPASVRAAWVASGRPPVRWSPQSGGYYFYTAPGVTSPTAYDPVVLASPAAVSRPYGGIIGPFNQLWGCVLPANAASCPGVPQS